MTQRGEMSNFCAASINWYCHSQLRYWQALQPEAVALRGGWCWMINKKSKGEGNQKRIMYCSCVVWKTKHRIYLQLTSIVPEYVYLYILLSYRYRFFLHSDTCVVLTALLTWESHELVACSHYNFHLGAFFLGFRRTIPDYPWASQLWQQRRHSTLDAGIRERNMKSLMLTIYTTDKYWIISFTLVHLC